MKRIVIDSVKVSIAVAVAIAIANILHLEYAISAGIVAVLPILASMFVCECPYIQ